MCNTFWFFANKQFSKLEKHAQNGFKKTLLIMFSSRRQYPILFLAYWPKEHNNKPFNSVCMAQDLRHKEIDAEMTVKEMPPSVGR